MFRYNSQRFADGNTYKDITFLLKEKHEIHHFVCTCVYRERERERERENNITTTTNNNNNNATTNSNATNNNNYNKQNNTTTTAPPLSSTLFLPMQDVILRFLPYDATFDNTVRTNFVYHWMLFKVCSYSVIKNCIVWEKS